MEFVSLNVFLPHVLPEVAGCSKYTATDCLRLSAIDFCKRTGVSVHTEEDIDLDAGEPLLELPIPGVHVLPWQVLWIQSTQGPITSLNRRSITNRGGKWKGLTGEWPANYLYVDRSQVQLIPEPDTDHAGALSVHCSYHPTDDATKVDEVLFYQYRQAITNGALYLLLRMSKEAWYDPKESREREISFEVEISEARALADKDFMTGEQSVQMRPMA